MSRVNAFNSGQQSLQSGWSRRRFLITGAAFGAVTGKELLLPSVSRAQTGYEVSAMFGNRRIFISNRSGVSRPHVPFHIVRNNREYLPLDHIGFINFGAPQYPILRHQVTGSNIVFIPTGSTYNRHHFEPGFYRCALQPNTRNHIWHIDTEPVDLNTVEHGHPSTIIHPHYRAAHNHLQAKVNHFRQVLQHHDCECQVIHGYGTDHQLYTWLRLNPHRGNAHQAWQHLAEHYSHEPEFSGTGGYNNAIDTQPNETRFGNWLGTDEVYGAFADERPPFAPNNASNVFFIR